MSAAVVVAAVWNSATHSMQESATFVQGQPAPWGLRALCAEVMEGFPMRRRQARLVQDFLGSLGQELRHR